VQAARRELDATANLLGLTRSTRFINALELGRARTKEDAHPFSYGYSIALEVPLFDWGQARTARAEAQYMQAVHRLADVALGAGADVRDAWRNYRHAWEGARHYRDEVVPLRKKISEETLLRYNGMLIGVNELLADSREQATSVTAAIAALRDFWVADATLQAAIDGAGSRPTPAMSPAFAGSPAAASAPAGH
jgi:outer membrane protein TolC